MESAWHSPDFLLEIAWGIIANSGDWDTKGREFWVEAAEEWREHYFNYIDETVTAD